MKLSAKAGAQFLAGAVRSENLDAMEKLLNEDKVDPNATLNGFSMLHIAAEMGHDRAITMLLKAGADVHQLDASGHSILRTAIKIGHDVSVKKLLEAGADPTATGFEQEIQRDMMDFEIAHRHGMEVATPVLDAVGKFNVNRAARGKDIKLLKAMLDRNEPPDTVDRFGRTGLAEAVSQQWAEGVGLLLARKADPNKILPTGWTAMHVAAAGADPEMIARLARAGGKLGAKTPDQTSVLEIAEMKGNRAMIDMVKKYLKLEESGFARAASELTEDTAAPQKASFAKKKFQFGGP